MQTRIITPSEAIKLTNTQRKKVYSTLNSDSEDESERLKKESELKENYKIHSQPELPEEKIRKQRVPKKDADTIAFEEKFKQIETGLNMFVSMGMDFLAERMPKKIPVTQTEKEFLSASLETVLKKYKSSMIEYIPEIMLIASTSVFIIPRMVQKPKTLVADLRNGKVETFLADSEKVDAVTQGT